MRQLTCSLFVLLIAAVVRGQSPSITTTQGIANGGFTSSTTISFRLQGTKGGFPSYGCKLDSQGYSTCLNPQTYTGLSDGTHTLISVFQRSDGTRDSSQSTFTWTIDTKVPSLVMTSLPFPIARPKTNSRSVTFRFDVQLSADRTGVSFQCQLFRPGAGIISSSACNSKVVTYSNLGTPNSDILYNFTVTATDQAGNKKAITTGFWIDLLKPTLWVPALGRAFTTIPYRYTNKTTATITFSSSEPGQVTYRCRRDGGIFQSCTDTDFSTTTYRSLPQGEHTFELQATDWAGNLQTVFFLSRPVNYSEAFEVNTTTAVLQWRVDTTPPPKPQFSIRPNVQTNIQQPRFAFTLAGSQIGGVSYSCGLSKPGTNYLPFPCFPTTDVASPASPVPGTHNNQLALGPHTLRVNAIDAAGNHGPSNYYTFTIDLEAPTVLFSATNPQVPPGPINNATTMTFNFYAVDKFPEKTDAVNHYTIITRSPCPLYNCTMECNLQPRGGWQPCTSPKTYTGITAAGVRERHTLFIRSTDNATNLGPATTFTWTTDRIPPTVSYVTTPNRATKSENATFVWTTTEPASEPPSFNCRLDHSAWSPCTPTPDKDGQYTWNLYGVSHQVNHLFEVQGIDAFGNIAANLPYTWTVDLINPLVTYSNEFVTQGVSVGNPIILANNSHTRNNSVDFKFSPEVGSTVTCSLDGGAYLPCTSQTSQVYRGLADGTHTFRVRAEDHVNRFTPYHEQPYFVWIVDTIPPRTRFLEVPNRYTNKLEANVSATANEPAMSFECEYQTAKFQAGTSSWLPCISAAFPGTQMKNNSIYLFLQQYTLSQTGTQINFTGSHIINVRAIDLAGNRGSAASFTWDVDLIAPQLTLPTGRTIQPGVFSANFRWRSMPDATFYFSSNEQLVNYTCYLYPSLNWTNPRICSSPVSYNNISIAGNYTFEVRVLDAAGNYDPKVSRRSFNWTSDPEKPTTRVISGPQYYLNRLTNLLFNLEVNVPRVRFECTVYRLHANRSVMTRGAWVPCVDRMQTYGKPASVVYNLRSVPEDIFNNTIDLTKIDGLYNFGARAIDVFNRTSDISWYEFAIDTNPPNTALEGTIEKATNKNFVHFSYFTTKQDFLHERFECRLLLQDNRTLQFSECDNGTYSCDWTECGRRPWYENTVSGLQTRGVYRFEIRAVDKAGNIDPTPISSQFIYESARPYIKIVSTLPSQGAGASMNDALVFAFAGDEGISFTCYFSRQDVAGQVNVTQNCKSPITYYPPPIAQQRNYSLSNFTVVGRDAAGNTNFQTYTRRLYNTSTLASRLAAASARPLPKECTNNNTIFAYIAIVFWALFILTIIVVPCVILRKMESKTPSKRRESRQPLTTSMGNPTFRHMDEDF